MTEPSDTHSYDWESLPDVLWEQINKSVDLLSTVHLVAWSATMHRLLIRRWPGLFQIPFFFMPDPRNWHIDNDHDDMKVAAMPLWHATTPYSPFIRHHYWWAWRLTGIIIIIYELGRVWHLVDVYTKQAIALPSLSTTGIGPRGPPPTPTCYARPMREHLDQASVA